MNSTTHLQIRFRRYLWLLAVWNVPLLPVTFLSKVGEVVNPAVVAIDEGAKNSRLMVS